MNFKLSYRVTYSRKLTNTLFKCEFYFLFTSHSKDSKLRHFQHIQACPSPGIGNVILTILTIRTTLYMGEYLKELHNSCQKGLKLNLASANFHPCSQYNMRVHHQIFYEFEIAFPNCVKVIFLLQSNESTWSHNHDWWEKQNPLHAGNMLEVITEQVSCTLRPYFYNTINSSFCGVKTLLILTPLLSSTV